MDHRAGDLTKVNTEAAGTGVHMMAHAAPLDRHNENCSNLRTSVNDSGAVKVSCEDESKARHRHELAHFRALLRNEVNPLERATKLTARRADGPNADEARRVRSVLLHGVAEDVYEVQAGAPPRVCVARRGVGHNVWRWVSSLSECGDHQCGTHRIEHPGLRTGFRDRIAQSMAEALLPDGGRERGGGGRVRYVSVGSGMALFDFDVLLALQVCSRPHALPLAQPLADEYARM